MKGCEVCGAHYRGTATRCPLDGGSLRELPDPLIGSIVSGRFLIEEKLGAGGMGTVYRARHELLAREVAVKFLSPELAANPTHRTRFLREARAANRIQHEHVIEITDYGETDDGQVYLVMEFLSGRPLEQLVRRGRLPVARAINITLQICRALSRAHELGIIHRDLKPDNVYLVDRSDGADFVKILDFGLAHMRGELRLTATGAVFGTPEYIAPEQIRADSVGPATDLYSLGIMLYEMLTGDVPFVGTVQQVLAKHMSEIPPRLHDVRPDAPGPLSDLVARLVAKQPEQRPMDAHRVLEELRRLKEGLRLGVASIHPVAQADTGSRLRSPTPHTRVVATLESWAQRVAVLRGLVDVAHPAEKPPTWLIAALDELDQTVQVAHQANAELNRLNIVIADRERDSRESRLRIGHALDALANDYSLATSRRHEAHDRLDQARRDASEAHSFIAGVSGELADVSRGLTASRAELLIQVGRAAAKWIETRTLLAPLEQTASGSDASERDLQFQLGELKKRMATIDDDAAREVDAFRAKAEEASRLVRDAIDELTRRAEPIVKHFSSYAHVRPHLYGRADTRAPISV